MMVPYRIFFVTLLLTCFQASCQSTFEYRINPTGKYPILNEDRVLDASPGEIKTEKGIVGADLIVNKDKLRQLILTEAKLSHDSLSVSIHYTSSAYSQVLLMRFFGENVQVYYQVTTSGEERTKTIVPIECKVELDSNQFAKGSKIRGHVELIANCEGEGCFGERNLKVVGNFKAIVR